MKIRPLLVAAIVFGIAVFIFWPNGKDSEPFRPDAEHRPKPVSGRSIVDSADPARHATSPGRTTSRLDPGSGPFTNAAPSVPRTPPLPPDIAQENLRVTVRQYGLAFGGNPIGTNAEITKALAGANPKKINFLAGDEARINGNGELVDQWGTPYFFHQLSAKQMEIRSAGPDKKMWTDDDQVIR